VKAVGKTLTTVPDGSVFLLARTLIPILPKSVPYSRPFDRLRENGAYPFIVSLSNHE
jgi:hypothetical protein